MSDAPGRLLTRLEAAARRFGPGCAAPKVDLLRSLARARLARADDVLRLHEVLCFLHALPDDPDVRALVERMLAGFHRRADLRAHRAALENSGLQGTDLSFAFYAPSARWLAARWGGRLGVDWEQATNPDLLMERIYLLALDAETPGLDGARLSARQWVDRMRRRDETDATFLVRRFADLDWDANLKDVLFQELDLVLRLRGGADTPSRTRARLAGGRVTYQRAPLRRERPDLAQEIRRPPRSVRALDRREGEAVLDLAREAMVTRSRDLDVFLGGSPEDVRVVDCGDGLELALIGALPEWRMLLECVYGWLILRNRVPTGYVLASAFLRSSEIAYNVFDTWRGGDAAYVYARVLAATHHLFGSDTFTVYPYQLGHENEEGLASGAWWFYQKLGFRPRGRQVLGLMRRELSRMQHDPSHRSSRATLERLARENVYFSLGPQRRAVIGTFRADRVGLAVTDYLGERFGSARQEAERVCADEAGRQLGARGWSRFPPAERAAWLKWSPLLRILPGVSRWSRADRQALVAVVRAKGGRRESDYVRRFDAHPRLARSLLQLARQA